MPISNQFNCSYQNLCWNYDPPPFYTPRCLVSIVTNQCLSVCPVSLWPPVLDRQLACCSQYWRLIGSSQLSWLCASLGDDAIAKTSLRFHIFSMCVSLEKVSKQNASWMAWLTLRFVKLLFSFCLLGHCTTCHCFSFTYISKNRSVALARCLISLGQICCSRQHWVLDTDAEQIISYNYIYYRYTAIEFLSF